MTEAGLHVVSPGLCTLVVDRGRPATRSLGVPVSGAADCASLVLGNALVGNPPDHAALEFSLSGPTLLAACDLACVVTGAPFSLATERQPLRPGCTFTLHAGEELHVGGTSRGVCGYLCVRGGLLVPECLGSRTSLSPLAAGAFLPCEPGTIGRRFILAEEFDPPAPGELVALRVLPGGQAGSFPATGFFGDAGGPVFEVTPQSNRMGLRLSGPPLPVPAEELLSEPVCPGTVQVTRNGQCIVLGVDGQTIGGYPKIAHLIRADLDRLGQLRPGQRVQFVRVTVEEAERLDRERQERLCEWQVRLGV
jgi:antagonist of KipI